MSLFVPDHAQSALQPVVADGLGVRFGDRAVLADLDLTVPPGRPTALVGENGSGKSTLLRALAGRLPERAVLTGTVNVPDDIVLLGQEPAFPDDRTIAEVLARALAPLRRLVSEVERLAGELDTPLGQERYAAALDRAVLLDAWEADRRALDAAARLGLEPLDPHRLVGTLSGGQRTRLALATVMTARPAAVLLDEPTNHLDDEAADVLAEFLRGLPGVVLVASHDRALLDDVCTDLVDLEPGEFGTDGQGGRRFTGGWSAYEDHRRQARIRWEQTWAQQQDELRDLRGRVNVGDTDVAHGRGPRDNDKFVHAFKGARVQSSVARRRRDAQRALDVAEAAQVRKPRRQLSLTMPGGDGAGGTARVRDLAVDGEDGSRRVELAHLDVAAGEHLLVTGPNGAGKSTLLGVLAGRIEPSRGTVDVAARRAAELPQDVRFADPSRSPTQVYAARLGEAPAVELRDLGLMRPADLNRPVGLLSVGQRRRLGLALVLAGSPDLLLLDEPTNHLSLTLAGELEEAVSHSTATVLVATHDRWLRRRWQGSVLAL